MSTKNKCQYRIRNLLSMFEDSNKSIPSTIFIRQLLEETPQCDEFYDLSKVRNAYNNKLRVLDGTDDINDNDIVNRIIKIKNVTLEDEKIGMVVVNHYSKWTQDQLISSLTPYNRLKYHISHKYERMINIFSTLTLGYEIYKVEERGAKILVKNSMDWINKKKSE